MRMTTNQQLRNAYNEISDRIANAAIGAGRAANDVLMIAVTKSATPDQIRMLVDLGHRELGESRLDQLEKRVATLEEYLSRKRTLGAGSTRETIDPAKAATHVRWHMIGNLQRNKVKHVVPLVHMIHSVDSLRLAEELHNFGSKRDEPIDVLLQVNASGETSKSGIAVPAVSHLIEQMDTMLNLRLRGLMTMAPLTDDTEVVRRTFIRTAEVFNEIKSDKLGGEYFTALSMGMSHDFELAIECGANVVRIGRALFGDPPEVPSEASDASTETLKK